MITPRGTSDATVLQTPRFSGRNSPRVMATVDVPMDLGKYQRTCFEAVANAGGELTQEVVGILHSIVRNAMLSGRSHARLQTMRISRDFSYRYRETKGTHVLHDSHTLIPFINTKARVQVNDNMLKLLSWMQEQGIHFVCTTKLMREKITFDGELPLADFVHIEAIFIPEDTDLREQTGRVLSLWNNVYTAKCLDNSMVGEWNKRALAAIRTGGAHCIICTLYLGADYDNNSEYKIVDPRDHLTMEMITPNPQWTLNRKFSHLVGWTIQLGYQWTLTCAWSKEEQRASPWAYFTILLDPLERYF